MGAQRGAVLWTELGDHSGKVDIQIPSRFVDGHTQEVVAQKGVVSWPSTKREAWTATIGIVAAH